MNILVHMNIVQRIPDNFGWFCALFVTRTKFGTLIEDMNMEASGGKMLIGFFKQFSK